MTEANILRLKNMATEADILRLKDMAIDPTVKIGGDWLKELHGEAQVERFDWMGYYRFLYLVAQSIKPELTVEVGTNQGTSAVFMKKGHPEGEVNTVDVLKIPAAATTLKRFDIHYHIMDSLKYTPPPFPIDLMFFDTSHTYGQTLAEYEKFSPLVRAGGVMCFDDVSVSPDMERFWSGLEATKIPLPELHHSGFGVVLG